MEVELVSVDEAEQNGVVLEEEELDWRGVCWDWEEEKAGGKSQRERGGGEERQKKKAD